jgi:lipoprotein-anchoring transpeptidase ErfK/SrfK
VKHSLVEANQRFSYRPSGSVFISGGFPVLRQFAPAKAFAVAAAILVAGLFAPPAKANVLEDFFQQFSNPDGYQGAGTPWQFRRQTVGFRTNEKPGTIIIDTRSKFLFYVLGNNRAIRYGVGVGREGFGWKGTVRVGRKAEWPSWTPPKEMIARERRRGRIIPSHMRGGVNNPLGARAIYLYNGGRDTLFRIHGTTEPWTIGTNVSSGCIRLVNADVIHLYQRVKVGAKVIVL